MAGVTSPQERLEAASNRLRSLESQMLRVFDIATDAVGDADGGSDLARFGSRLAAMAHESLGHPNRQQLARIRDGQPGIVGAGDVG